MSTDGPDDLPEGMPEHLKMVIGMIKEHEEKQSEQVRMAMDANNLQARRFVEGLSNDQLDTMVWLVSGLAAEGTGNYATTVLLGILIGTQWSRTPMEEGIGG